MVAAPDELVDGVKDAHGRTGEQGKVGAMADNPLHHLAGELPALVRRTSGLHVADAAHVDVCGWTCAARGCGARC